MHLRVKTYLKCLRGFQRKHSSVGVFLERPISSCWTLLHPLSYLIVLCLRLQEAFSHLQNVSLLYSMYGAWTSHPAISPSCLGISKCSDYRGKEDQGKAPLASLCASQDDSQLDGNVSWGPRRRKGRVSKQVVEQISHTYCLLLSSHFTCACACTVPLILR